MRIDAHQHFWQNGLFDDAWRRAPGLEALRENRLPEHLAPALERTGIDRTVAVQTQHSTAETRWLLELAERHATIAGVVGWIDLASPECEAQLAEFLSHPGFKGVRHVTQDEPDDDFIVRPDVLRGLRVLERHGVPFDLLFHVRHLRHAVTLAEALPDLPMVIDHLAKPRIAARSFADWGPAFRAAARYPNVYCKLSGLVTEADPATWQPADLAPYVQTALDSFGAERCMFGSDWPVCALAADYEQVHAALREALGDLDPPAEASIFGGTAATFYRLRT